MKSSIYNSYISFEKQAIIFNSSSLYSILIENENSLIFDECKKKNDFSELKNQNEYLYNSLIEGGFIVPKPKNEYEEAVKKWKENQNRDHKYELHINPTMDCNFNCWYCFENHVKGSKMALDVQNRIVSLVENILNEMPNLKYFDVKWFGGEPLLFYKKSVLSLFDEIYRTVKNKNEKVIFRSYITTNGSLINDSIILQFKKYNVQEFQITLDGNRERHNQVRKFSNNKGSYNIICNNIKKILQNNIRVSVRINCSEETINNLEEIVEEFINLTPVEKSNIVFDFHKIWQIEKNLDNILRPKIELFKKQGFKVSNTILNVFNYVCYADRKYNACINYNGDVFKCTARDFCSENKEGVLNENGKIIWNNKLDKRLNSKFQNTPCVNCRIFPLCGGGCSQKAMENKGKDYCVFKFDNNKIDESIIEYLLNHINNSVII